MYLKIAHNLTKKKITFDHINHKKKRKFPRGMVPIKLKIAFYKINRKN